MKKRTVPLSQEVILEVHLSLISNCITPDCLNFRALARQLGCAHQSLYRYFPSYNHLQQATRLKIMALIESTLAYGDSIVSFSAQLVDFALDHPKWYVYLWTLDETDNISHMMREAFAGRPRPELMPLEPFLATDGQSLCENQARHFLMITHTYLHGALIQFISGRHSHTDPQLFKSEVLAHIATLLQWACKLKKK